MVKRVACFALGGHIANQNASFKELTRLLEPKGYEFYGAENAFKAFETQKLIKLSYDYIPDNFAGFVAGAGRFSLLNEEGKADPVKLQKARDFFIRGKFDIAIGSGGDDHGMQMEILRKSLEGILDVYVMNKTMDNDLGGRDGVNGAPFTDFTNGFHTAVSVLVRDVHNHLAGSWTNNLAYLVSPFGRETNWVALTASYYSHARLVYGELTENEMHSLRSIADLVLEEQDKNEKKYGRRIAIIMVPEGTRVEGVDHASDEKDAHSHPKLNPEDLVLGLRKSLKEKYKINTSIVVKTYELRDSCPTTEDVRLAKMSAKAIADAVEQGNSGMESVFKIEGPCFDDITADIAPINDVSRKRYSLYYPKPLWNPYTFEVTDEIGKYYRALFGERKGLGELLPGRPCVVTISDLEKKRKD